MTLPATIAREVAWHFEAKKTGFGQAQDGWSITLRVQHDDLPREVKDARKGTRYMVALVEIGDDEQPVVRKGREELIFTCLKCEANYHVEVETDECPVCFWKHKSPRVTSPAKGSATTVTKTNDPDTKAAPDSKSSVSSVPARRRFEDMSPAQQAGMLCQEKAFWKFLREKHLTAWRTAFTDGLEVETDIAADVVRQLCNVTSRADLTRDNTEWSALVLAYRLWQREPEYV